MAHREYPRQLRVATELQRALNELLRFDVKDPRLDGVTVSALELSRDLSHAQVYFSSLSPDADGGPIMEAFTKATGFLRSRLAGAVTMRRVPELHFHRDDSIRRGLELSQLIDRVAPDSAEAESNTENGP